MIWADRYDGDLSELFDLQDRIATRIVWSLAPHVREAELKRARRKRPENMNAYDLVMQAIDLIYRMNFNGFPRAGALFGRPLRQTKVTPRPMPMPLCGRSTASIRAGRTISKRNHRRRCDLRPRQSNAILPMASRWRSTAIPRSVLFRDYGGGIEALRPRAGGRAGQRHGMDAQQRRLFIYRPSGVGDRTGRKGIAIVSRRYTGVLLFAVPGDSHIM